MKTVAIIQCRMGSSRLPGKSLMPLAGRPVVQWVYDRARAIRGVDAVLIATTAAPSDDVLVAYCEKAGIPVFRGSESDVLDRYCQAARSAHADIVMRITGDCPLLDPVESARVLDAFLAAPGADYASNTNPPFLPDGLDTEVIRGTTLERVWRTATDRVSREHVTWYVNQHAADFHRVSVAGTPDRSALRLTLDERADYEVLSAIAAQLQARGQFGHLEEVLQILADHPGIVESNAHIGRNEGLAKSIAQEERRNVMNKGQELYREARALLPGGTQLLSKRPEMFAPNQWPAYYARCEGARVWDLDGRAYHDMSIFGVGSCPLGYADPDVNAAVKATIEAGSMCTLNAPEEVALAKELCRLHPWAHQVRYARCGGESMAVAVRIARAATGRNVVLFCGYHGWSDWYLAANLAEADALGTKGLLLPGLDPAGVPASLAGTSYGFRHNQVDEFRRLVAQHRGKIAAIVAEPQRSTRPAPGFLEALREAADAERAVLVFDEITSGFRLCTGGVHLLYGVTPDLAVFAKGMSNGYAMGAVIGRESVMQAAQSTFMSSTYWTERIGPTAALATIRKHAAIKAADRMIAAGRRVQAIWSDAAEVAGLAVHVGPADMPPLSHISFDYPNARAVQTLLCQEMLARGFLDNGGFYATTAHTDEVLDAYAGAVAEVFPLLAQAVREGRVEAALKGPVGHSGFARLA